MNSTAEKSNILIVDDNISLQKTLSFILLRKGYRVATASSGTEAVEISRTSAFDLIFTDVKMPDIDGVETFRRIRRYRPDALVVMMTAYAVDDLIQQAIAEGAIGVINKPLDIEKVISLIENKCLDRPKGSILVIDDEPQIGQLFKKQLEKFGYDVEVAHSGEDAIEKNRRKKFDIFFIDICMPGLSGGEVFAELKKIQPDATAVLMTGYMNEFQDVVDKSLMRGAYTCLFKPLSITEISRLADEIMTKHLAEK